MRWKFIELFKQRGMIETLLVLHQFPNFEVLQKIFHIKLQEMGSYYQAYLRVKADMIHRQWIAFKLDQNYERVIFLTEKGQRLSQKINELENSFDQKD